VQCGLSCSDTIHTSYFRLQAPSLEDAGSTSGPSLGNKKFGTTDIRGFSVSRTDFVLPANERFINCSSAASTQCVSSWRCYQTSSIFSLPRMSCLSISRSNAVTYTTSFAHGERLLSTSVTYLSRKRGLTHAGLKSSSSVATLQADTDVNKRSTCKILGLGASTMIAQGSSDSNYSCRDEV
jgi:hypothetical protein